MKTTRASYVHHSVPAVDVRKMASDSPRDFSQDVDRKYSLAELIHTGQIWRAYLTTVTIQPVQW